MIKEEPSFELPLLNLKCAKKEQGEKAYVIDLLKKAIDICDNNLTSKITGDMLLKEEYFGKIYKELTNISKNKKWFWKVKSNELDILNHDKVIHDIFMRKPDKKVKNFEYYRLNYIERSLIFLELDALAYRSMHVDEIFFVHWQGIRNGFMVLLFNIIKGVYNKEINQVSLKIREDGTIIDCVFSYGRALKLKNKFNPKKICEEMLFYKSWSGELYSLQNKMIKETYDYTNLCCDFNLNLNINGIEEENSFNVNDDYVGLLEKGVELKHLGKYEEAKETYVKAIYIDNTQPTAYYNLGKILYILSDYKASAKAYKASFERGICEFQQSVRMGGYKRSDSSAVYIHLGHALLDSKNKEGQYGECIKEYEEGIDSRRVKGYKPNRGQARNSAYNEYDKMCFKAAKEYLEV